MFNISLPAKCQQAPKEVDRPAELSGRPLVDVGFPDRPLDPSVNEDGDEDIKIDMGVELEVGIETAVRSKFKYRSPKRYTQAHSL